jgi:hypothetical protein
MGLPSQRRTTVIVLVNQQATFYLRSLSRRGAVSALTHACDRDHIETGCSRIEVPCVHLTDGGSRSSSCDAMREQKRQEPSLY